MAKSYQFEIDAHPSVYEPQERKLKIYFSEPEKEVNDETGILLLIAGFGGHANSNVCKKMRNTFADQYNLLTVQCDYFGWEFMQGKESITDVICDFSQFLDYPTKEQIEVIENKNDIEKLMEIAERNHRNFRAYSRMEESWSNFNDLGFMQAIDNITAVMAVMEVAKDNGYTLNSEKIIVYGHSQGAYLAHLCNLFSPNIFSLIIDNSAWIVPGYLKEKRKVQFNSGIEIIFDYLVSKLDFDEEIYDLQTLYRNFDNTCAIIAYHGVDDDLVDYADKKKLIDSIPGATFYLIDDQNLDNEIFRSTAHGLNADFIKMFQAVMDNYTFRPRKKAVLKNVHYHTSKADYYINYENGRPELSCIFPE